MGNKVAAQSYWYEPESSARDVLEALRAFRRADAAMRDRMAGGMAMNETDMRALQIVISAERERRQCTARELATGLAITTASTAKLLNRLVASGHLVREPSPRDKRSVWVRATEHAHAEVRERLAAMHADMARVVDAYGAAERAVIASFLLEMARVIDQSGDPTPEFPLFMFTSAKNSGTQT